MIYEYVCENGHHFERILPVKDYKKPQTCECGAKGEKKISIPRLNLDMQPWDSYISPASGKLITSYKERRADMAAHGCVDYDPGMKRDTDRKARDEDRAIEKKIDETVEKEIHTMPARKREKLTAELEGGADCTYDRRTV